MNMNKHFLLKYRSLNHYLWRWEDKEKWFDTKEEMISFIKDIKKGTMVLNPEDIKINCAFELNEIDIESIK